MGLRASWPKREGDKEGFGNGIACASPFPEGGNKNPSGLSLSTRAEDEAHDFFSATHRGKLASPPARRLSRGRLPARIQPGGVQVFNISHPRP